MATLPRVLADMDDDVIRCFYVYKHVDSATGVPFYVGKGRGRRAYHKSNRTQVWKDRVASLKDGYDVEIVEEDLTERAAYGLEFDLISELQEKLANQTAGGSLSGEFTVALSFKLPFELPPPGPFKDLTNEEKYRLAQEVHEFMTPLRTEFDRSLGPDWDRDDDLAGILDEAIETLEESARNVMKRKVSA